MSGIFRFWGLSLPAMLRLAGFFILGCAMAQSANRPCLRIGCRGYAVQHGYCADHVHLYREPDRQRGTASQRGYGSRWQQARLEHLYREPLCRACQSAGRIVAATVVDHIQPHKGDHALFWRRSNWQSLCESCHNRKTATEDKGAWHQGVGVKKSKA